VLPWHVNLFVPLHVPSVETFVVEVGVAGLVVEDETVPLQVPKLGWQPVPQ
jgi:hypothetical protein